MPRSPDTAQGPAMASPWNRLTSTGCCNARACLKVHCIPASPAAHTCLTNTCRGRAASPLQGLRDTSGLSWRTVSNSLLNANPWQAHLSPELQITGKESELCCLWLQPVGFALIGAPQALVQLRQCCRGKPHKVCIMNVPPGSTCFTTCRTTQELEHPREARSTLCCRHCWGRA